MTTTSKIIVIGRHQSETPMKSNSERHTAAATPMIMMKERAERRADLVEDRAIKMIEAVLTYVEANAIDFEGVWLDEGCEDDCEEFIRQYIDEKNDVDPPSFNAKHPRMRISHFPNIIRNYLTKYANPLIPSTSSSSVLIIATPQSTADDQKQPSEDNKQKEEKQASKKKSILKNRRHNSSDEEDAPPAKQKDDKNKDQKPAESSKDISSSVKFAEAQRIISFLTPLEKTILARLTVHIAALHHRACFNGLTWQNLGTAFAFLMRAISTDRKQCEQYATEVIEFFATNIDSLFDIKSLELLGQAAANDGDYGTVGLSVIARETYTRAKFRLFPGSSAADILVKNRARRLLEKRKSAADTASSKYTWVSGTIS